MNRFRRGLLAVAASLLVAGTAQAWPNKPISLIVPFPAGGTTDVLARALAERLTLALGQTVIVESKPGAGATLGADMVAKARPDGYTLLVGAVRHTIARVPNVLVVNAASPAKTVAELVALGKASKDKLSYGSNGNGTAQHLIGMQFVGLTGVELLHIPYKGSGPLTTGKRSSALPEVPTLAEAGLRGFDIGTWFGVLAPAATPKDAVARLSAEMMKIIQSPDFRKRMEEIGAEPIGNTPEQMTRQMRDDTEKFARLVREARVTIE